MRGLCDAEARRVTLCPTVPPGARLGVLLHELWHAWGFCTGGPPTDREAAADYAAAWFEATLKWLSVNGGPAALLRLQAGESLQPGAAKIMLTRARACAVCTGSVAPGSVTAEGGPDGLVRLALACDFCGHVQRWAERSDIHGQPTGETVGDPTFERGEVVGRFESDQS